MAAPAAVIARCTSTDVTAYRQDVVLPEDRAIEIPAGSFPMGADDGPPDAQPRRVVYLRGVFLAPNPVTNAEYFAWWSRLREPTLSVHRPIDFPEAPWPLRIISPGARTHPVVGVRWPDAAAYAAAVGGRLPTEAEWEKAARGPQGLPYPWGLQPPVAGGARYFANFLDADDGFAATSPPGFFNGLNQRTYDGRSYYGANDMAGNVWEWVNDWYAADYYRAAPDTSPPGPPTVTGQRIKVLRGGSWRTPAETYRTFLRASHDLAEAADDIGFRVAWDTRP